MFLQEKHKKLNNAKIFSRILIQTWRIIFFAAKIILLRKNFVSEKYLFTFFFYLLVGTNKFILKFYFSLLFSLFSNNLTSLRKLNPIRWGWENTIDPSESNKRISLYNSKNGKFLKEQSKSYSFEVWGCIPRGTTFPIWLWYDMTDNL